MHRHMNVKIWVSSIWIFLHNLRFPDGGIYYILREISSCKCEVPICMVNTINYNRRLVNFYHSARHRIPEHSFLYSYLCENPKSHVFLLYTCSYFCIIKYLPEQTHTIFAYINNKPTAVNEAKLCMYVARGEVRAVCRVSAGKRVISRGNGLQE